MTIDEQTEDLIEEIDRLGGDGILVSGTATKGFTVEAAWAPPGELKVRRDTLVDALRELRDAMRRQVEAEENGVPDAMSEARVSEKDFLPEGSFER